MISIKEFCKKFCMCRGTYTKLAKQGMPVIRVVRKVWIDEEDAIKWMKENTKK